MSSNKKIASLIIVVVFVLYNILAFAIPAPRSEGFFVAYIFTWLSIILAYFVLLVILKNDSIRAMFLGMPFAYFTSLYVILQMVASLVIMFAPVFGILLAVVLESVLFGVFVIVLLAVLMGRKTIEENNNYTAAKQFYIRSVQSDIAGYRMLSTNAVISKQLSDLEETIKYSDPMSSNQLAPIENKIEARIRDLGMLLQSGNMNAASSMIQELQMLFAERNRMCKMMK